MCKLIISKNLERISSINRTIRMKPEVFEKLMLLSKENEISFNRVVGQCLEYALSNLHEDSEIDY